MKMLKRFFSLLDENLERYLCVVIVALMFIIVFYQVVLRYVFNSPNNWSEELARYLHIYMIFICGGYATKMKAHVRVDVLINVWPRKLRPVAAQLGDLLWLAFCFAVVFISVRLTRDVFKMGQMSIALRIPLGYIYMALPIGYAITIIRLIQIKVGELRKFLNERRNATA